MTVFSAPILSDRHFLESDWIDYNGHLNMAYYHVLFDRCVDSSLSLLGLGSDYVAERHLSFYTVEVHIMYLRELHLSDTVRISFQLLDYDEKRLHFFQHMHHYDAGWVAATSENMCLHVDMSTRRVSPFPQDILSKLEQLHASHSTLLFPENAGRSIGIRRKKD